MKYRTIGTNLNRDYRNDLNYNFQQIEDDIKNSANISDANKQQLLAELARVERESKERDDLLAGESLDALLQSIADAKQTAYDAAASANLSATNAEGKGDYAKEQGDYAKSQGDHAKLQGDYAKDKAVEADTAANKAIAEASNLDGLKIAVTDATQEAGVAAGKANASATTADSATLKADTAADNATTKALDAETQGDYAKEQGDYSKLQGDHAKSEGDKAALESAELSGLKTAVSSATDDALTAAELANVEASGLSILKDAVTVATISAQGASAQATEQANYAEQQGDYAKAQGDAVQGVFDAGLVASVNGKTGGVVLTASDVGAETEMGAQDKADAALTSAKTYTATEIAKIPVLDISGKVDKVVGKQLTTEDYTSADKEKLSGIETGAQKNVIPTKAMVGLNNVDDVKQMPLSGGSFTGISNAFPNTSYTVAQLRNVILSPNDPVGGEDGEIWIKYK